MGSGDETTNADAPVNPFLAQYVIESQKKKVHVFYLVQKWSRQYNMSKLRRHRMEAALRRWGKSLSPVETINSTVSSPFQETATLSPMETMDSVSPPPFQETTV